MYRKRHRKVTDKVTEKVTERRHLDMQFCNDAIDERAIRLPWNRRKRNASLTTRALDKEERGGESYSPVKDAAVSLSRALVIR